MHTINVDFNLMRDIAYRGIRRTAAFMGLGVNAARDDQFKKYQLSNISMVQVLSDKLDDKDIAHIKEEFEKWVISNDTSGTFTIGQRSLNGDKMTMLAGNAFWLNGFLKNQRLRDSKYLQKPFYGTEQETISTCSLSLSFRVIQMRSKNCAPTPSLAL
jgi:hypothetical protein